MRAVIDAHDKRRMRLASSTTCSKISPCFSAIADSSVTQPASRDASTSDIWLKK